LYVLIVAAYTTVHVLQLISPFYAILFRSKLPDQSRLIESPKYESYTWISVS